MSFAVRNDGQGWRAVNGPEEVGGNEVYSEVLPPPVVIEWSPTPTLDKVRAAREVALNRLAGIAGRAYRGGDNATAAACDAASDALLGITTVPAAKAATDDAGLKVALMAAYIDIIEAAPANIQNAFSEFRL